MLTLAWTAARRASTTAGNDYNFGTASLVFTWRCSMAAAMRRERARRERPSASWFSARKEIAQRIRLEVSRRSTG